MVLILLLKNYLIRRNVQGLKEAIAAVIIGKILNFFFSDLDRRMSCHGFSEERFQTEIQIKNNGKIDLCQTC